jgi:hypothetical protein
MHVLQDLCQATYVVLLVKYAGDIAVQASGWLVGIPARLACSGWKSWLDLYVQLPYSYCTHVGPTNVVYNSQFTFKNKMACIFAVDGDR